MSCLNLQRNSEVYFSTVDLVGGGLSTSMNAVNTWKVEVLAGFAATAGAETQDITSMESGTTPDRSQQRFNTAINPVDWNFQTYVRPTGDATKPLADWYLWQALMDSTAPASGSTQQSSWATNAIDSTNSNFATAQELNMYLKLDQLYYQVKKATVNQLTMDAGIEEIATATWTGFGTEMVQLTGDALTAAQAVFTSAQASTEVGTPVEGTYHPFNLMGSGTNEFIKNRLSTITINHASNATATANTYTFAVTALSFDYTNNITYLTPEELDALNVPIGQFTGTRAISGSATMYLRGDADESAQFLNNIYNDTRTTSAATSNATVHVGGASAPNVAIAMETVQFSFPEIAIEDVIAVSVEYVAQESTCGAADEVTITALKS